MTRRSAILRSWLLGTCSLVLASVWPEAAAAGGGPKAGGAKAPTSASAAATTALAPPTTGCQPGGTPKDDVIVCTGTDFDGIDAGRGSDSIWIMLGSRIVKISLDPLPQTTAVEGGEDNDTITNDGDVVAVSVSLGNQIKSPPASGAGKDAGAASDLEEKKGAQATGIQGDEGDDTILNTGSVSADAVTTAVDFAVGGSGLKVDIGASDANAGATAIDGGDGNDSLTNTGEVVATATAVALKAEATANLGLSSSDDAATATATAVGMQGGAGDDTLTNSDTGNVTAVSTAVVEAEGGSGSGGPNALAPRFGAASAHVATANSTGLSGGDGTDTITNDGTVSAVSTAVSGSLTVDIRANGAAKAISTSKAESDATAIDSGEGDDTVTNHGDLSAVATSVTTAQSTAVSKSGKAPRSRAAWGGGATAEATAVAINSGAGIDAVYNDGAITAVATAVTATSAVGISAEGVASADSTSTAKSTATAIDAGDGSDTVTNDGTLTAVSTATAGALDIAFSYKGESKAEQKGGATAEAEAVGISADGTESSSNIDTTFKLLPFELVSSIRHEKNAPTGADTITNSGAITAVATAVSGSASVAISVEGAVSASAKSTAKSTSAAIDAGNGDDIVSNAGELTAVSTSTALGLGVGVSVKDKSDAKAGVTAEAEAFGIRGDGTEASSVNQATLELGLGGLDAGLLFERNSASGNDTITNSGAVTAVSTAVSGAGAVAVAIEKASSADATSTAKANAIGIEAGAGDDTVTNSGDLVAVSTATAGAIGVGVSVEDKGVAKATATSEARAAGIMGDGAEASHVTETNLHIGLDGLKTDFRYEKTASTGIDMITNSGEVTAVATAVSGAGAVAVSIKKSASAEAKSVAQSTATAIDAGNGDDTVTNSGELTAVSTSTALALGVGVADGKGTSADASADAEANAVGISGDGNDGDILVETALDVDLQGLSGLVGVAVTSPTGNDTITNDGAINAVSVATSGAGAVTVSISGGSSANMSSTAKATSTAIDAGAGTDIVTNTGDLTAVSVATAGAFSAAVAAKGDIVGFKSIWSGGTNAEAVAQGITGDSTGKDFSTLNTVDVDFTKLDVALVSETAYVRAGDNDTITNSGQIDVTAVAVSPVVDVAVAVDGKAAAVSNAKATAKATAINAGTGDDTINNSGDLVATSVATAGAVNVAVSKGASIAANTIWKGGTEGTAEAIGISGDGEGHDWAGSGSIKVTDEAVVIDALLARTVVNGNDAITNEGAITATSVAAVPALGVSVSVDGAAAALSTAGATSRAAGIDAGAGDDTVTNSGKLTATSVATAVAMNVAVGKTGALAGSALWQGGTTTESEAIGISGDGQGKDLTLDSNIMVDYDDYVELSAGLSWDSATGTDTITNSGDIDATSVAVAASLDVAVAIKGVAAASSTSKATSKVIAIDAGAGSDIVTNSGNLTATSVANADTVSVAVTTKGVAVAGDALFGGGTEANSEAVGISGDGDSCVLRAESLIYIEDGDVFLGAGISTDPDLIGADPGNDNITNSGDITATSVAVAPSLGVSVVIKGVAASSATATANSRAVAIDAGRGADIVSNTGNLTATSVANADAVSIAVTTAGVALAADAFLDSGTVADAEAVGISGDGNGSEITALATIEVVDGDVYLDAEYSSATISGDDELTNTGSVTSTAVAVAASVDVAVALKGVAGAVANATANSRSVAIDAGAGDDIVWNEGALTSTSVANADAISVALTGTGLTVAAPVFSGGATADAEAIGISGDGKGSDLLLDSSIAVVDGDVMLSASASDTVARGEDTITNTVDGSIVATSVAAAPSLSVSVAVKGVAAAATTATGKSRAVGIDAGAADDEILNQGSITATSVANADAISVAVTTAGVAVATDAIFEGGTTAEAEAIGISGDGRGSDLAMSAGLEVTSDMTRLHADLSSTVVSGNDEITNEGPVTATSVSVAASIGVSVALQGVAGSVAKATSNALAMAIDGGAGNDIVINSGELTATSVANADAISVAFTTTGVAGAAAFDGGATANAEAIGISGDGKGGDLLLESSIEVVEGSVVLEALATNETASGDDDITNSGKITATSVAVAPSLSVAVALNGVAGATASATGISRAAGIDAGSGNDIVFNQGEIISTSVANADGIAVTVVGGGVALSTDAIFQGGTKATAEAVGISGDGEGADDNLYAGIEITDEVVRLSAGLSSDTVSGDDRLTNEAKVTATAVSVAASIGVGVAFEGGVAGAVTKATSNALAMGMDGGAGNDIILNSGELTATSVANADAISVAYTTAGVAGSMAFDGGAVSNSEAIGISGDGKGDDLAVEGLIEVIDGDVLVRGTVITDVASGDDDITNTGKVTATSVAVSPSLNVSVALGGVAVASTSSTANARAAAIDGGAGNDEIDNYGSLVSTAVANADGITVAVTPAGVALAVNGVLDGGTVAEAEAVGISGDGDGENGLTVAEVAVVDGAVTLGFLSETTLASGNDRITNRGDVTATAVAVAPSLGVSVAVGGVAIASSTATATTRATAIDGSSGDDEILNSGTLVATSVANADGISVSITPAGLAVTADAVFEDGTLAEAEAIGISGDGDGTNGAIGAGISVVDGDVTVEAFSETTLASGNDRIINESDGEIVATAVAVAPSIGVSVAVGGVALASSKATARTRAAAIDAGDGDDDIYNAATLTATSVANADAISVSVTPAGVAGSASGIWDGGATAEAEAVGISGDGTGANGIIGGGVSVIDSDVIISAISETSLPSGNDTIINDGEVTATAVAVAPSIAVSVAVAGVSGATSSATAEAHSAAIDGGSGDDEIENTDTLAATSVAVAGGLAVGVTPAGVSISTDAVWDGGTTAITEAVGIYGDGRGNNGSTYSGIEIIDGDLWIGTVTDTTAAFGNDRIFNFGDVTASAVSVAPSIDVAVVVAGVSAASSKATAVARAAAIDAGAGDDWIENYGTLQATTLANADGITVSVTIFGVAGAIAPVWDGGTTAIAESIGISGDGNIGNGSSGTALEVVDGAFSLGTWDDTWGANGNDTIINLGSVSADAVAIAPSISVGFNIFGVSVAASTATADALAVAIDAGAGDDVIDNSGELNATSASTAVGVSVGFTLGGVTGATDSVWDGGTHATAEAVGISGDGTGFDERSFAGISVSEGITLLELSSTENIPSGNDWIRNDATITTEAVSVAPSAALGIAVFGVSGAMSTSTAISRAAGIDAGAGDDEVENSGYLDVTSFANADAVSGTFSLIGVSAAGTSAWDGGTKANAEAVGISGDGLGANTSTAYTITATSSGVSILEDTVREAVGGNDLITNDGDIDVLAEAVTVSADIAITGIGVAAAVSTSTAEAKATAINAGVGEDTVTNTGNLRVEADADAVGVAVAITPVGGAGAADAVWDGGTKATADAVGISGDGNGENVTRQRGIVIIDDDFDLVDESERETVGGADTITNYGTMAVIADATSTSVDVAATVIGVSAAASTSTAEARSTGISADAGDDEILNDGAITAISDATATAVAVSITGIGAAGSLDAVWDGGTTSNASSTGINGGSGSDQIESLALVSAYSTANTASVDVAVDVIGAAGAVAAAEADAESVAIAGGDGDDSLVNRGGLVSDAKANATGTSVTVALAGFATANTSTNANARSSGIDGGSGNDTIDSQAPITSTATATATGTDVAVGIIGAATPIGALDGETLAETHGFGLTGGDDGDTITNHSSITLDSTATTTSTSVTVELAGFASADATARASANGTGMAGDGGIDVLDNRWLIDATVTAEAPARSIAVGIAGASVADASTIAEANAVGMDGGAGDDEVINNWIVDLDSDAKSPTTSVVVELVGAADAIADTTSDANAVGLAGGAGEDDVSNSGLVDIEVTSEVTATSVNVTLVGAGKGSATSTARAGATGMAGDAGNDSLSNQGLIDATTEANAPANSITVNLVGAAKGDASTLAQSETVGMDGGDGDDSVVNNWIVALESDAKSPTTSVVVALVGAAEGNANATSDASVVGLSGGAGEDEVINAGFVDIEATSEVTATSVTVTLAGAGKGSAGATAKASATGMAGGDDDDFLNNLAVIDALADANAPARGITVGLVGASEASASTMAEASTVGIDGGNGNDTAFNNGDILLESTASSPTGTVVVELVGAAKSDASTTAQSNAIGMAGGAGEDMLVNVQLINMDSTADANAESITVTLVGASDGNASATASASATGMAGGDDADHVENQGLINIDVTANAPVRTIDVEVVGALNVDASTLARTNVIGLDGGAGNDTVRNFGDLILVSNAKSPVDSISVQVAGAISASAGSQAISKVTGLAGGGGTDELQNFGLVNINSTANATVSNTTIEIFGAAAHDARATGTALAIGADAGQGNDTVMNLGTMVVKANANAKVSGSGFTLFGSASQLGLAFGSADATGLKGGSGIDYLYNQGLIDVDVNSMLETNGDVTAVFGGTNADASVSGALTATGISGDEDDDEIVNFGIIDVDANLTGHSLNSSWTLFGSAQTSAGMNAVVGLTGINGGLGNDLIINADRLFVTTHATLTANNSSWTLGGSSGGGGSLSAFSGAVGIAGGDGSDTIVNDDFTDVQVFSSLTVTGGSKAIFGKTSSGAALETTSVATGIDGGSGDDQIENFTATLNVLANASLTSNNSAFTVIGAASVSASLNAIARATGIIGGTGNDTVLNNGLLSTTAISSATANGQATSAFSGSTSVLSSRAQTTATGFDLGWGDDSLFNQSGVTVTTITSPSSINDANVAGFFVDGVALASAFGTSRTTIVDLGQGANSLANWGSMSAFAEGTTFAKANSSGSFILSIDVDNKASAYATFGLVRATGIAGGDGVNVIDNKTGGRITVWASPVTDADANANGNAIISGDGTAIAATLAHGAQTHGIALGNGNNFVRNSGSIWVVNNVGALSFAESDADGLGFFRQPDSIATAWSIADYALAVGIRTGHGNNQIYNGGSLIVAASPFASSEANGFSGAVEVGIDAFATTLSVADNAQAYGILTGGGDNTIWNTGAISVQSIPFAWADSDARGRGWDGDAEARATAYARNALAVGIQTGSGDDVIWNEGSIYVEANPSATATVYARAGCQGDWDFCNDGEEVWDPNSSTSGARAIGISTGGGDDEVWNAGTITTVIGSSTGAGTGVDLGAGDDTLVLLGGSQIFGSALGGTGSDSLLVDGNSLISSFADGFETLTLYGTSELDVGTVYTMPSTGTFNVLVNADGSHGQLDVGLFALLNGGLTVSNGAGIYVNGTTYDVVKAGLIPSNFSSTTLPTPTALLSFSTQWEPTQFLVIADVASFTTVASESFSDQSFAKQMDGILPSASGDLEALLIQMQQMPVGADFAGILSDLNPANYSTLTESALTTVESYMGGVGRRLASLRSTGDASAFHGSGRPLSYAESEAIKVGPRYRMGTWAALFTQSADIGSLSGDRGLVGTTTGIMSGFDFGINERTVIGAAFGSTLTVGAIDEGPANANVIEGYLMSLYGAHRLSDDGYVNAQLSYGRNTYRGLRSLDSGIQPYRIYRHGSESLAARLEAGHALPTVPLQPEAFASFEYKALSEDGFDEFGGRGLSMLVDDRTSRALETELGVRISRSFDTTFGQFQPQVSLAWVHDFYAGHNIMTARFADVPDYQFAIPVGVQASNGLRIDAALGLFDDHGFSVSANFESDLRRGAERGMAKVEMKLSF